MNRWMEWKPKGRILGDSAGKEPTKPSKPGSVGFEGATSGESPKIDPESDPAELTRASAMLNRAGVRIMALEGGPTIGMWGDLDGPAVRAALQKLELSDLPVLYLESANVPARYKQRPAPLGD